MAKQKQQITPLQLQSNSYFYYNNVKVVYDLVEYKDNQDFENQYVSQPPSLKKYENESELRITKEWLSTGKPGLIFVLLMFGGWGIFFALRGLYFLVIIMFILFGLNVLYYIFVYGVTNTTEIKLTKNELVIEEVYPKSCTVESCVFCGPQGQI